MTEPSDDSAEIKETDIVFDCPFCGKSLAIDYRGAGLNIPCTDCGKQVSVPIPEGMELTDIDSTDEEQEIRILNLRRTLMALEERVEELEAEIDELNVRRKTLEEERTHAMYRCGAILEKTGIIQKSLDDIARVVDKIVELAKGQS